MVSMFIHTLIRRENAAIPDETLSRQMDTLSEKCEQIFRTVSEAPAKAPQVRKFMDYYLPTTLKMLQGYRKMDERQVSGAEAGHAGGMKVACLGDASEKCAGDWNMKSIRELTEIVK